MLGQRERDPNQDGRGGVPEKAPFAKVLAGGGDADTGIAGGRSVPAEALPGGVPEGWRDKVGTVGDSKEG